jgi:hypothetical protein
MGAKRCFKFTLVFIAVKLYSVKYTDLHMQVAVLKLDCTVGAIDIVISPRESGQPCFKIDAFGESA